jgi:hypothetical protein
VYYTTDTGVSWQPLGTGLPFSAVDDLVLHNGTRVLRAATHGRSFFEFDLDQIGIKEQEKLIGTDVRGIYLQVASPSRDMIRLSYRVSKSSVVRINIYDVAGRMVLKLVDDKVSVGKHGVTKQVKLPAGTYFVRMEAQGERVTQKIDIVK